MSNIAGSAGNAGNVGQADRPGRNSRALDAALAAGNWSAAMDAAYGSGGWGRGSRGYNASNGALSDPRVSRFTETQQRGFLSNNLGQGMMGAASGDLAGYYRQKDYEDLQAKIKKDYANRLSAYNQAYDNIFGKKNMSWDDKFTDLKDLRSGKVGALEARGYDMDAMRATHNSGGLLGAMFGTGSGADDVETVKEVNDRLGAVDPNNPMGYSALGYGLGAATPGAAQFVANYTESPYAGMATMYGGKIATSRVAPGLPGMSGKIAAGLGMAGVPGVGYAGGLLGLANRAADLNYAGYTGSVDAPQRTANKENNWWPTSA